MNSGLNSFGSVLRSAVGRLRGWAAFLVSTGTVSVIVTAAGVIFFVGRWLDLGFLSGSIGGLPNIALTSALALALAGISLGLLRRERPTAPRRYVAVALASGTVAIALVAVMGHLSDLHLMPMAPAFYAAVVLLLLGAALPLLDVRPRRLPQPAQLLALIALHIVLLALLGQVFGNPTLYVLATTRDTGMSLPTALMAAALAVGVLNARPGVGFTAILRNTGNGGLVARRLLLVPIVLPLVLALIIVGVRRAGVVSQTFGGWLFTAAYFTGFTLIIWWVASVIRRAEVERDRAAEALGRLNDELEARVAERTSALTEANTHLARRNQENETFVYTVSHDLRSPLVNLQGFAKELASVSRDVHNLLADGRLPEDVRRRGQSLIDVDMAESIHFIQTAVVRLGAVIDALLRLSRVGRIQYQWQSVDLNTMADRVVETLHGTIRDRGARVTKRELPAAWGDPTALEQLFANLIGNALNYLDPKRPGEIEVGGRLPVNGAVNGDAGFNVYYVKDNGLGIPDAHRPKLFQAFQRLHPDAAPGEGMGLTIVHRIAERHGGRVWLESSAGAGTTFFVALPTAAKSLTNKPYIDK
jgi:signal transduction histidine kinase